MSAAALALSDTGFVSLALYWVLAIGLVVLLLAVSALLGVRRRTPEKDRPYEGGVIPTGPARLDRPVPFFLAAVFFLVFDVEVAFVASWAVAYDRLGWTGWFEMAAFIGVLLVGLAYVWRKGGLDWGPGRVP